MSVRHGSMKVIPIRDAFRTQQTKIVERAFTYWRERLGLREGSPEEDLLRAREELLRKLAARRRRSPAKSRLFVVSAPDKPERPE